MQVKLTTGNNNVAIGNRACVNKKLLTVNTVGTIPAYY